MNERTRLAAEYLGLRREDFVPQAEVEEFCLEHAAEFERRVELASLAIERGPGAVADFLRGVDPTE